MNMTSHVSTRVTMHHGAPGIYSILVEAVSETLHAQYPNGYAICML